MSTLWAERTIVECQNCWYITWPVGSKRLIRFTVQCNILLNHNTFYKFPTYLDKSYKFNIFCHHNLELQINFCVTFLFCGLSSEWLWPSVPAAANSEVFLSTFLRPVLVTRAIFISYRVTVQIHLYNHDINFYTNTHCLKKIRWIYRLLWFTESKLVLSFWADSDMNCYRVFLWRESGCPEFVSCSKDVLY